LEEKTKRIALKLFLIIAQITRRNEMEIGNIYIRLGTHYGTNVHTRKRERENVLKIMSFENLVVAKTKAVTSYFHNGVLLHIFQLLSTLATRVSAFDFHENLVTFLQKLSDIKT